MPTFLVILDFIRFELCPYSVDDLISHNGPQENLYDWTPEAPIEAHLFRFRLLTTRDTILRHFHVCVRVGQASCIWYLMKHSAILFLPLEGLLVVQAQTPQQRKANERYARQEAAKRGKPESAIKQKQKFSPPISPIWIGALSEYQEAESNRCIELISLHRCPGLCAMRWYHFRALETLHLILLR